MKISLPKGKYILAVSGGVDSMVLLDLLVKKPGLKLVVAHFNHQIRPDSVDDENLVAVKVKKYGLGLEIGRGGLGQNASEAEARQARYKFLNSVKAKHNAKAIITAHHQDDLIETALLNLLRGTGPRGLVALGSNPQVIRPLVNSTKSDIERYAKNHKITWNEDPTNVDRSYLRNYLRHEILPKMTKIQRQRLLANIEKVAKNQRQHHEIIATISRILISKQKIDRELFISLPLDVGAEILVHYLRSIGIREFNQSTINRLNLAIRTASPGSCYDAAAGAKLRLSTKKAWFEK